jgi:rhamnose transport system substrate-binding protein
MKKFLTAVVMLLMIGLLAACSNSADGNNNNQGGEGGKARHAIVFKNTGNPYGEKQMEGFKNAIEELGDEAILRAPDQPTAEAQIKIIEELIAQKVDSIAIVANDFDALEPVLKKAMDQGIKVLSLDSAVNPDSRMVHVNQADPERIGRIQIEAVAEMMDYEGQFAILSATSQASNQNLWISWMEEELKDEKYANMELVKIAYGDDLRDKSVSETEALLQSYPDLKAIVAPTTVGIAAASKVVTDKGLQGKVFVTGLGLPSEMKEYIKSGVSPWMYLWNPLDVGYLAGYASKALVDGKITGAAGESFEAGDLGTKEIVEVDGGTEIMLGDPFKFDPDNIDEWAEVY